MARIDGLCGDAAYGTFRKGWRLLSRHESWQQSRAYLLPIG
jgi:hypothetical protein